MSSPFMQHLELREHSAFEWELMRDFPYAVGGLGSEDIITVPKGFITDLASIPRPLWGILPPHGKVKKPAIIHDYLCVTKTRSSVEAADIFLEAMKVVGIGYAKRYAMYWGVRVGGPRFKKKVS